MKKNLPYILILVVLLLAAGAYLDLKKRDMPMQAAMVKQENKTRQMANKEKVEFQNYGIAPDFTGIASWINSEKLSIAELKGKVVLVDFWTYSCINCIRTLPYVTKWFDTYRDKGLVIVGVHTPEFGFEKEYKNVVDAVKRFGINYPVAQDNDYSTWRGYNNQYWPAKYLIDQKGNVVYVHFGEGEYEKTESAIRQLLGIDKDDSSMMGEETIKESSKKVGSPEMYFGTNRLEYLDATQKPSTSQSVYEFPRNLSVNNFALSGTWKFNPESIISGSKDSRIRLKFSSGKVHMVAQSLKPQMIHIVVDSIAQEDVWVDSSKLYTLFNSESYTDHVIEITIPEAGFEAFTFTFG